jgi:hypothetical protein
VDRAGNGTDQEPELSRGLNYREWCYAIVTLPTACWVFWKWSGSRPLLQYRGHSTMTTKLGITVAVDVSSHSAVVAPEGRLTLRNVQGLIAVARRAGSIEHGLEVSIDLRRLSAADPQAVAAVRAAGWGGSQLTGTGAGLRGRAA